MLNLLIASLAACVNSQLFHLNSGICLQLLREKREASSFSSFSKEGLGNAAFFLSAALCYQSKHQRWNPMAKLQKVTNRHETKHHTYPRSIFVGTITAESDYHPAKTIYFLTNKRLLGNLTSTVQDIFLNDM